MRKLLWICLVVASVGLACKTGRSNVDMAGEFQRLNKEMTELENEYEKAAGERRDLEVELERTRAVYEEARIALARRDALRLELEAQGYSPAGAEAYSAVASVGGEGQIRREVPVAEEHGGAGGSGGAEPESERRPRGRYTGPHTIHVVAKGEYLYKIAAYSRYYGDGEMWPLIFEANGYQVKDPHWIFAGQRLQIPTP